MESLKPFHSCLENLQTKAKSLTTTGLALNALLTEAGIRLSRGNEASRLKALYRTVLAQLERVERSELSAKHGHSQADLIFSLGELAVGGIMKMTSKSKQQSAMGDYLLQSPTDKRQPFGLVMISTGAKGLPDDAHVVSISQLARESSREESDIINKLREDGYLLFNEKTFSLLIDRLVTDIRDGRLHLPVSGETLFQVISGKLSL